MLRLRRDAHADAHAVVARLDRPGAIAAKFAAAGDALVLPDLLQNIADRPLDEVRPALPHRGVSCRLLPRQYQVAIAYVCGRCSAQRSTLLITPACVWGRVGQRAV